jgi:hypothetical protein
VVPESRRVDRRLKFSQEVTEIQPEVAKISGAGEGRARVELTKLIVYIPDTLVAAGCIS